MGKRLTVWTCAQTGDCCRSTPFVLMHTLEADAITAVTDQALTFTPDPRPGFLRLKAAPCPLLDEHNRCTVYAVRPYVCRRYGCFRGVPDSRDTRRQHALMQRKSQRWADTHGWTGGEQ